LLTLSTLLENVQDVSYTTLKILIIINQNQRLMKILNVPMANYLLVAILAVAAILRLNHINQPFVDYISWRQASTAMMADNFYRTNWNIFYPAVNWHGPEPSYQGREFQTVTYIAALLYVLIGQHDWIGRSVAVVFGLWGIFALYQLVRLVWDEKYALASATVMAILPGSIFVERSFLPDPAMVSLVVTSFWMLVAYLQTDRLRYLVLASIIGAWGFLTKIPGLIVGIPMLYAMVAILGRRKMLLSKTLTSITIAAVLTLIPVVAYYLWARHIAETYPPYHFAGGGNWIWDNGFQEWWEKGYFLYALHWNYDRWIWTKVVTPFVFLGLFLPLLQSNQNLHFSQKLEAGFGKAPWVFHWWMLGGVIYYIIGAQELVANSWNFHIINPAASALAGRAIVSIVLFINRIVGRSASIAVLAAIILVIGGYGQKNLKKMYSPPEPYWDATQGYKMGLALSQISSPKDLVVTISNDIGEPVAIYYSQRRGWVFPPAWNDYEWSKLPKDDNEAIRRFEGLRFQGADWFGIVNEHRKELTDKYPKFMEYIERTCKLEQDTAEFVIYRILPLEEMKNLQLK
jgi:hypothetical protein